MGGRRSSVRQQQYFQGGSSMPKWIKRMGAAATIGAGLVSWAGVAQATTASTAAPPTISLGAAKTAATLPAGCTANDVKVVNSPDGSYHGYLQATCAKVARLFYISRDPTGVWALRTTTIDMPYVLAVGVDNTGTYFVGRRSNDDLVLVRRNGNGSLSGVHVLEKNDPIGYLHFERASVVAGNGQYWVAWDENGYSIGFQDHLSYQSRTQAPAVGRQEINGTLAAPTLLVRPGKPTQLVGCYFDNTTGIDLKDSTAVSTTTSGTWGPFTETDQNDCFGGMDADLLKAAYLNGHTYFSEPNNRIVDDVSGTFTATTLSVSPAPEAFLGLTRTRVAYVAADGNAAEFVWLQNSAGAFPGNATGQLSKAPVPMHTDQIINRSGKLIRIFIQDDGKGHGGRRLLEQKQS
jgi:hypothetical protein